MSDQSDNHSLNEEKPDKQPESGLPAPQLPVSSAELDRLFSFLGSPQLVESIAQIEKQFEQAFKGAKIIEKRFVEAAKAAEEINRVVTSQLVQIAEQAQRWEQIFKELYVIPVLEVQQNFEAQLTQFSNIAASIAAQLEPLDEERLREAFELSLKFRKKEVFEAQTARTEESIAVFVILWVHGATERYRGLIQPDTIIVIIVTLLVAIYTINASSHDIDQLGTRFEQAIKQLEVQRRSVDSASPKGFIIKTHLNLRVLPSEESTIIQLLHPNQEVELIQEKGDWVYVKYFDYTESLPRMGWVAKEYLTEVSK